MDKSLEKAILELDQDFREKVFLVSRVINELRQTYLGRSFDFKFKDNPTVSIESQKNVISFLYENGVIYLSKDQTEPPAGCRKLNGTSFRELDFVSILPGDDFKEFFELLSRSRKPPEKPPLTYSAEESTLYFRGYNIPIQRYSKSEALLHTLINTKDEYYSVGEMLDFDTINSFIEAKGLFEIITDFYAVKKVVNEKIFKIVKLEDFLILKDKMIGINPKYT